MNKTHKHYTRADYEIAHSRPDRPQDPLGMLDLAGRGRPGLEHEEQGEGVVFDQDYIDSLRRGKLALVEVGSDGNGLRDGDTALVEQFPDEWPLLLFRNPDGSYTFQRIRGAVALFIGRIDPEQVKGSAP